MPSYLTRQQIEDRLLSRFGYEAEILDGDADIASDDLDSMRPFLGRKTDSTQAREFPRNSEIIQDDVLDWVALRAYQLATDDEAPVSSESAGRVSVSYFRPKLSQTERRMRSLRKPYRNTAPARIV